MTCSLWLRRLDLNQRPSGISHKASPCLPLENIVAPLAWSASRFSLFSHLSATPVSAAGGGVPLRPNERSSPCHNPEKKRSRSLDLLLVVRMFIRDLINTPKPYNHIFKNAHFSIILFCGTMYLQRRILHYES